MWMLGVFYEAGDSLVMLCPVRECVQGGKGKCAHIVCACLMGQGRMGI